MNIFFWVLQVLLALHTLAGAVWKFSNSEQAVPSLSALPHAVWMSLIALEIVCAIGLVAPAFFAPWAFLISVAALGIALEMLLFVGVHLFSGASEHGQMIYWIVVALIAGFLAYGRFALEPL